MNPRSNIYRALIVNPGASVYLDEQRIYARNLEVPSGNAVGTARGIAHAYSVFAGGGGELGLRQETLRSAGGPGDSAEPRLLRRVHEGDGVEFSLGFMKSCPAFRSAAPARPGRQAPAARWALPIPRPVSVMPT